MFCKIKFIVFKIKICGSHDYCYIEMPKEDNKMLKHNHGETSMKVPFIFHVDLECLLEKYKHLS